MNRVIVIEFTTLDGIVEDPDGSAGTPHGGWVFRYGPEAVANDPFELGPRLSTGALVLGRATWELFSKIWPDRSDDFSMKMNAMPITRFMMIPSFAYGQVYIPATRAKLIAVRR